MTTTLHISSPKPRSPNLVHLDDEVSRRTRFVFLYGVPNLDIQFSGIFIVLPARKSSSHDGALVSSYRFMEEENRLLPMGRRALRAGTEARYPLLTGGLAPTLTRSPFRLEFPSKRPHLRDDRRALVRDLDFGRRRDRHSQRREERVEVQHEAVDFRAFCRGADEGK